MKLDAVILKRIGYWRSSDRSDLPDPHEFIDTSWDTHDRDVLASYFDSGTVLRTFRGQSECRICGKSDNGSAEYTDGTLLWPEGFAHYIRDHSVRPPEELLDVVRARFSEFEDVTIDANWWKKVTKRK